VGRGERRGEGGEKSKVRVTQYKKGVKRSKR
jgi:hypothetical protein